MSSHTSNSPSMAADLKAILEQHQNVLASEIEDGRVVQFLVQHGTLSVSEVEDFQRRTNKNERVAFFCSLIADKGFSAFRDLCLALEKECPHLLTNFLLESARVPGLSMSPSPSSSSSPLAPPPPAPSSSSRICPSPNRRSRLSVTSSTSSRCTSPSPGDSTSPLATPLFPPTLPPQVLTHTPPLERRPPSRAPSAASLLSPFASLTRRLGAKHKKTKNRDLTDHATARMTTPLSLTTSSRGPTPADFGGGGGLKGSNHSRPVSPASAYSIYSTFPRPPPSSSPSATHPPLIHQLLMANASRNSSPANLLSDRRTPSFLLDRHSPLPALPPRPPSESNPLALVLATPTTTLAEVLDEPVEEEGGDRVSWEYHQLALNRVPGYGFGIAVSGGRDNPHFANGDPAIAISDVLKGGPAEGKLQINDRVLSANGVSLDNVDYATAVQVLRDSGAAVHLVVKRRIVHGASSHGHAPGDTYKVTLTKSKKKEDFGLTFGSRLYVKELNHKALQEQHGLQEGDWVVQINTTPTEGLSLKEAKKLMDAAKDKLTLTIRREQPAVVTNGVSPGGGATALATNGHILGMVPVNSPNGRLHDPNVYDPTQSHPKEGYGNYESRGGYSHSSQNLYVQPPTRGGSIDYNRLGGQHQSPSNPYEEKSNLSRVQAQNGTQSQSQGRSRGPIMDLSLSQLDQPLERREDGDEPPPPRPPPPRPEDYYSSGRRHPSEDLSKVPMPDPRFISFQKEGSVGIRLTGGNHVGIFVTAVQPGSPAALQGLTPGDKILKVNEMDMKGVTREEAVLFLLSLQDQIDLIVQHRRDEYDMVLASGHGDSFYVKTHFTYDHPKPGELAFRKGEVFHVLDTLHNGVVGAWQVARIGASNTEVQKGVIPNSSTAEELATAQFNAAKKEATASESRGSFFRRRRSSQRRSKSLGRDHWDEVVFAETLSKFPAYERVVLRHPGFVRPVVLFGAVADLARDKLLKDYPDKFASPLDAGSHGHAPRIEDNTPSDRNGPSNGGIVRLSAIRDLVEKGRHALLDITPGAVDKLNYAQFYPVVIFLRPDSKHAIKELRAGVPKSAHRSSKKIYEQCVKLEKLWSHVFTVVVPTTSRDTWYRKLREAIDREQNTPIWVSETKLDEYLSDDFLFPMTSRLSYASSPESDLDLSPEPRPLNAMGGAGGGAGGGMGGKSSAHATSSPSGGATGGPRLVKSSSDPSIATQEDLGHAHISHFQSQVPPPYTHAPNQQFDPRGYEPSPKRPSSDAKYGFGASKESRGRHSTHMAGNEVPPPDLPPRVDRSSKPGFPGSTPETSNPGRGGKMSHSSHPAATSTSRSAQERLFGVKEESPGDETGLGNGNAVAWTAKDRPGPDNHPGMSYDSSSSYESYNRLGLSLALPPPGHSLEPREHSREDPNKNGGRSAPALTPTSPTSGRSPHDPYRFTRSTSQPVRSPSDPPISVPPGTTSHLDHAAKYSSSRNNYEYKPSPPPKSYKPVPPPKPKNYRPPNLAVSSTTPTSPSTNTNTTTTMTNNHSSHNYWNHSPPSTLHYYQSNGTASRGRIPNGVSEDVDSGQGSSLDRHAPTTPTSPRSQYYYNLPPPRVDLAQHRERGSAFELYQKPKDPRAPYHAHHAEHNVSAPPKNSVLSTARGWFGSEGGRLDTPEGVALIVPPGALPEGSRQEMYIQVCGDQALYPPLDQDKGEQLLSPLVLCGPHGLRFLRPVELQLPHHAPPPADTTDPPTAPAAATPSPAFRMALKASDTPQAQWQQLPLDTDNQPCPNNNNKVSVFVDHF